MEKSGRCRHALKLTRDVLNKNIRKHMSGELKQIAVHEKKIADELEKPHPGRRAIAKWQTDITKHKRIYAKLAAKLPGGGK